MNTPRSSGAFSNEDRGVDADTHSHYSAVYQQAFKQAFIALVPTERALLRHHLIDRLSVERIAVMVGTPRATVAGKIAKLRRQLALTTKHNLMESLALGLDEAEDILRMVATQLDVSVHRMLRDASS